MDRYQHEYASNRPSMYDRTSREKRAERMIKTLAEYFGEKRLSSLTVLDVGSSTGIIDNILSKKFKKVVGSDIDEGAVEYAKKTFKKSNLEFRISDAMNLPFAQNSFDVVICAQVYEHVPNTQKLFNEIYRVLKPGGVCYLAALNKLRIFEPHYGLPFLSWLPKGVANFYLRVTNKGNKYFETLRTYWELQEMNKKFEIIDWTREIILNPKKYGYDDKIPENQISSKIILFLSLFYKIFSPTFFWLLVKPKDIPEKTNLKIEWAPTPTFLYRNYLYRMITSKLPQNSFFLDVGTGNGILLNQLIKEGFRGDAIDFSIEAIEFARIQLEGKNKDIVKLADLFKYKPEKKYDFVLCFETLEHIKNDLLAMEMINNLLKPGGMFILSVPAHKSEWSTIDEIKGHFRRYEKEELRGKLLTSGFSICEIYSYGFPLLSIVRKFSSSGKLVKSDGRDRTRERTKESSIVQEYNPKFQFLMKEFLFLPLFKLMDLFLKTDLGIGYIAVAKKVRNA